MHFHVSIRFRRVPFIDAKDHLRIVMNAVLNLPIYLGRSGILTLLGLSFCEDSLRLFI